MSREEKLELIGRLITELQESKERLAALEYKADRIGQRLAVMESFARKISHREQNLDQEFFFCGRQVNAADAEMAEAMDFPALMKLADEIAKERARLADLERHKKQLGL